MSINSCSVKYLDKAFIGVSVRLTGGKNCVKFENKPMTGVEILDYSNQGFRIFHKDLPKEFWLDFGQLPLTKLKIVNGIIKNEITFVENIIRHQTQFIKTTDEAYVNAKAEFELDKTIELLSPTKLKPGQKVISAQCKDSIELIFLGNFYSTEIEPLYKTDKKNSHYYGSYKRFDYTSIPEWRLSKREPQITRRAYFLRKDELGKVNLAKLPKGILFKIKRVFQQDDAELKKINNWAAKRTAQEALEKTKRAYALQWFKENKLDFMYTIVTYPITNKYVKQLMPVGVSEEHTDINKNMEVLKSFENYNFYYTVPMKEILKQYLKGWYYSDHLYNRDFLSMNKKTILEEAQTFINVYYQE